MSPAARKAIAARSTMFVDNCILWLYDHEFRNYGSGERNYFKNWYGRLLAEGQGKSGFCSFFDLSSVESYPLMRILEQEKDFFGEDGRVSWEKIKKKFRFDNPKGPEEMLQLALAVELPRLRKVEREMYIKALNEAWEVALLNYKLRPPKRQASA